MALDGRCPHRHFPLGKSRVVGDNIECGYHGITFAPDGSCVRVPSQKSIPQSCHVRSYTLVERWQWVWIWMGDPMRMDESLIPDHDALNLMSPEFQVDGDSYREVPGRYMLMHDNLFDLTHFAYLHRTSIGSGDFASAKETRSSGETWVSSHFDFSDIECPPFYAEVFGYSGRIDREFGMKAYLPCLHAGYDRFYRPGANDKKSRLLGAVNVYHAITPSTNRTAHYFFAMGRTFKLDDAAFGRQLMSGIEGVILEDMQATREIESLIGNLSTEPKDLLLKADTNCVLGGDCLRL